MTQSYESSRRGSRKRTCPQCWLPRAPELFVGARGRPVRWCAVCRARYGNWSRKTPEERLAVRREARRPIGTGSPLRAKLFRSGNRKLGGIPASITSRETCPDACSFRDRGCYAEFHHQAAHWRRVCSSGDSWADFCASVAALPEGQLWRHNVAGDLPGVGDRIHPALLGELAFANAGKRGFTFTHKPVLPGSSPHARENAWAVRLARAAGLAVNLSADDLAHADALAELGVAPVAVVLPRDAPVRLRTPAGRRVVVCPAQTAAALTCATCGLCAVAGRKSVVGFRAHGQAAAEVDARARRRLPVVAA